MDFVDSGIQKEEKLFKQSLLHWVLDIIGVPKKYLKMS